jgi:uncharacterized membrane protein
MNNDAQLHLVLSHFPIVLPFIGMVLFVLGWVFKSMLVKRIGFFTMIIMGVFTFMMMQSGEGAEEIVEQYGRRHEQIHEHEEHGEKLALINYFIAVIALVGIWSSFKLKKYLNLITVTSIVLCLASSILVADTAEEGGRITHDEAFSMERTAMD